MDRTVDFLMMAQDVYEHCKTEGLGYGETEADDPLWRQLTGTDCVFSEPG